MTQRWGSLGDAGNCCLCLVDSPYLVEVFRSCPHFLPRLVQELDADAEKLLEGSVVGEEHWVEIVAGLTGWKKEEGREEVCRVK